MKINCIAIDDEPLALDIIKNYSGKVPFLKLIRTFTKAVDSIEYIQKNHVDLIFLDVQMEGITGLQLINALKKQPQIILTTAFDKYAVQGFELDITDYLLKPISFERFIRACDRAYDRTFKSNNSKTVSGEISPRREQNYFFVKTEFRLQKINFDEILYIEGMGDYLRIVSRQGKIMTLQNFKRLEEILPEEDFCRVHKSYMISLKNISCIEKSHVKISDKEIPISDFYRNNFYDKLKILNLIV
jgi:DNA-binding LytR/AlgR family response regulator